MTVAEISSFQLETSAKFAPKVSAILNITPDHLNRHHTMEELCGGQGSYHEEPDKGRFCVLNYEDESCGNSARHARQRSFISHPEENWKGIYLDGRIYLTEIGAEGEVCWMSMS